MTTFIYNPIMAMPVVNSQSPLEPVLYTLICIMFPIVLAFFLKKKEDNEKVNTQ